MAIINDIATFLTPAYIAGTSVVLLVLYAVFIKINYEMKLQRAGGVRTPLIAGNPIAGEY